MPDGLFFHFIVEREKDYFNTFYKLIEDSVKNQSDEIKNRYNKEKIDVKPEDEHDFEEYFIDLSYGLDEFQQTLYKSFLISIFSYIDYYLAYFCEAIFRRNNIIFSHRDLKGDGASKAVKYIEKTLGIDFPQDKITKESFRVIKLIRNLFTHNNGYVEESEKQIVNRFISAHPTFLELKYSKIIIKKDFIEYLLKMNDDLISELQILVNKLSRENNLSI